MGILRIILAMRPSVLGTAGPMSSALLDLLSTLPRPRPLGVSSMVLASPISPDAEIGVRETMAGSSKSLIVTLVLLVKPRIDPFIETKVARAFNVVKFTTFSEADRSVMRGMAGVALDMLTLAEAVLERPRALVARTWMKPEVSDE